MGWSNISQAVGTFVGGLSSRGVTPVRVLLMSGAMVVAAFPFVFPFTGASGSPLPTSPTP